MSKTGPRYTTAFDNDTTRMITTEIKNMAKNINRHIALNDIKMSDLRDVVIPPDLRDIASDTARHYIGHLSSDAFQAPIARPRDYLNEDDVTTQFGGMRTRVIFALTTDTTFVVPPALHKQPEPIHYDTNPELAGRIEDAVSQWAANGIRWAFVLAVFEWVNDWVGKGQREQARLLLPGVLSLLRRAGQPEFAAKLEKPKTTGVRRPVPPDIAPALRQANEIIVTGLLYPPKTYAREPGHAHMRIECANNSLYPLWGERSLRPILDLS
jgi:hypothetical protein